MNLKQFIIYLSLACFFSGSVSSKINFLCLEETSNKTLTKSSVTKTNCHSEPKEKSFKHSCFDCECNLSQIQTVNFIQNFKFNYVKSKILENIHIYTSIDQKKLDPPPKSFS
jgi:hypothetical protein